MPRFPLSVAAAAIASALASGAATAQFSNFYFFGDSLTDAGSYRPVLPADWGSLFTTNPGPIWAQALGARYGFAITPANQGGTDYAYGGARVTLSPGEPPAPPTGSAVPIATQVQTAVGRGIDANAAYFLWGGPNDVQVQLRALIAGQITATQLQANVATAATQYAQQVAVLQNGGARYVVVLNMPDLGRTASGQAQGPVVAAQLSQVTNLYNSTAQSTLDAIGGNQIRVNINGFFNEFLSNPAAYGFVNTTGVACANPSNIFTCNPSTLVAPNAAQTYVFADGYHPTTAGHALIAQLVASMLEGPMQIGTLAEAPLAVEQAQFRALDGRMWSALGTPASSGRLQSWIAYDYGNADLEGSSLAPGDSDQNSVALGLDMRVSPNVLAGLAFGYTENKVDFNGGGGFKLRETSLTAYGGWGNGPWYVGGSLLLANLDYGDVQRNVTLGPLTRTESGDTNGSHWALRLLGGYWFTYANLVHGPFAKVVYQEAEVDTFSENSGSSTALRYERQKRESLITSLGWQAQGQWGMVRPFGRATWEWEAKDDLRYVTASSATLGGSYSVPAYQPGDNWGLFLVGASMDFGKVTGYISGSATAGKNDGEAYGITVGVRVPL